MRNVALAAFAGLLVVLVAMASKGPRPPVRAASAETQAIPNALLTSGPPSGGKLVRAQAFGAVPGAVVCPDYKTVTDTVDLYAKSSQEQAQDQITHGQSRLVRGPATPTPDPQKHGCILLKPNTSVLLEDGNVVPVVSAKLGQVWTKGVTLSQMLTAPGPTEEPGRDRPIEPASADLQRFAQTTAWAPATDTANAITGPAEFSTRRLVIAGRAYPLLAQGMLQGPELAHALAVFKAPATMAATAFWFRVAIPDNAPMLDGSRLCGEKEAVWMLAVAAEDQLYLAFYSPAEAVELKPPASGDGQRLCAAFSFVPLVEEASDATPAPTYRPESHARHAQRRR